MKHTYKPLVSVVIPVFNGAAYLVEAMTSIQKSTYRNFEVLLIDDGSSDTSKEVCQLLAEKYKNVRFFDFAKNKGLGRVLNFALKHANGKYICRLNQDDKMLPHRLATQVEFLQKNPKVVAVGSSIRLFDARGRKQIVRFLATDEQIKQVWYIVSPFADPSVMYRKDVALAAGGYDQNYWPADDTHLWYRMGMRGSLANIQKPVVNVRWHDKAASVFFFRKLAMRTYKMHLWTNKHIKAASWYVHLFWICQLISGLLFSPHFNWGVYRVMKRGINAYEDRRARLVQTMKTINVAAVKIQPKKLSLSGV